MGKLEIKRGGRRKKCRDREREKAETSGISRKINERKETVKERNINANMQNRKKSKMEKQKDQRKFKEIVNNKKRLRNGKGAGRERRRTVKSERGREQTRLFS